MDNSVPFEIIEQHKENIEPIREGRSVLALSKVFGTDGTNAKDQNTGKKAGFEQRIKESEVLDDPIEPYLDYIKWIMEEYPQGQTSDSGLVEVLERCTSAFRDASFYKDDARYLRVWLQYIRYSDSPKEIFTYLARKEIGMHLATFYEEYAAFLESSQRKKQAGEIYRIGIELNARPIERLKRRYDEFCERMRVNPPSDNEPGSPILPAIRPALSTKMGSDALPASSTEATRRLQVLNDISGLGDDYHASSTGGWDSISSLASRKKENTIAAKPWTGEQLQMNSGMTKPQKSLSVFRDPTQSNSSSSGKRPEKMLVATEFLYDENGEEYCLEEILARARGILEITYPRPDSRNMFARSTMSIPLKDSSPTKVPRSPTMTLHTKAATEEIYQMFNQPLKQDLSDESSEESSSNDEENDEMTDSQVSAGMNRLSESTNELSINEAKPENSLKTPVREFNGISRAFPMTPIAEATETGTQFSKKVNESSPYINPMDKEIRNRILVKVTGSLINYYNHAGQDMSKEQAIKRALNGVKAKPGDKNFPMIEFPNGEIFCVRRVLGEGGFGSVFLAESGSGELSALKSENKVHSPWEYYILRKLNEKLQSYRTSSSIIQARSLHCYDCESYMTLDYLSQGTLLDMVNLIFSSNEGNGLEECLMMFFTIEILRAVESMHEVGIIHGDLKPDNVMLRLSDIPDKDWSKQYTRTGENGWNAKGIVLIDFGRAIDMSMLEHNVQFVADWKMDDQDCIEMKEGRPWTYQADYHGIASIVHVLLFGKFIKVVEDEQHSTRIFRISSPFKRYWQRELWEELFYVLLNSETASPTNSLPITPLLAKCREKLETKLEEMCESSTNSLKGSLRGIEHDILQLRKKT